ncbi:MAG: PH domain-containing protein [Parcubacteria group bacterium]|nr:PH domain-containing protein [Parcubacteria group bacterium]
MLHLSSLIQAPEEQVLLFLRRHIIILYVRIALFIILGGLPFLFQSLLVVTGGTQSLGGFLDFFVLAAVVYELFLWLFLFINFVDYYLDIWIVTNRKIIAIEQRRLFHFVVSELDLSRIQDVTSEVIGIFPALFNYGDVLIQTAGTEPRFKFSQVPDPAKVRRTIQDLIRSHSWEPPSVHAAHAGLPTAPPATPAPPSAPTLPGGPTP